MGRPNSLSVLRVTLVLNLFGFLNVPLSAAAVDSVTGQDGGSMIAVLAIVVLGAVALGLLIIAGLVRWSHKQEHTQDMMLFCMKHLVQSKNETERCNSAMALKRATDPAALLVLEGVVWDEEESEGVRKAAGEALQEMRVHSRKYDKVIGDLELATENKNLHQVIEILIASFERGTKRYVQNSYLIGRHFMRLEQYADAREWSRTTESRNQEFNWYGSQVSEYIQVCNSHLLEEADDSFKAADYQQARERYAALAHGLSVEDSQRFAVYLRSACVYCKLGDYLDADQALLQALEHNHATDLALTLVPLLQELTLTPWIREVMNPVEKKVVPNDTSEEIKSAVDERSGFIMKELLAKYT